MVYHKDHELYGIYQAKKAMSKEDCVYMVEGYTDVISMHQCGIENVVANSGTALSVHQIRLLHRFTQNVVLLYDGDEAGIHAALRGTDMMLAEGMNIKVLLLPDGDDPDSFARKHTASDFKEYIASHQTDFMEFKTQVMLKGVNDPVKRAEAISSIVKSISEVKDPIIRATYVKDCSQRTGIAEQTLINQMNKFIRSGREERARQEEREKAREEREAPPTVQQAGPPAAAKVTRELEQLLVQMVLRHGEETAFRGLDGGGGETYDLTVAEYIYYDLQEDGLRLLDDVCQGILEEAVTLVQEGNNNLLDHFIKHPDPAVSKLASLLGEENYRLSESMRIKMEEERLRAQVEHLLLDYRLDILKNRMDTLRKEFMAAGSDEQRLLLLDEVKKLQEMRTMIAKRLGKSIII